MEENFKEKIDRQDYTSGDTFFSCHVERAANLINGKWKILILFKLSIHDIKKIYPVSPPKVEYYLTERGKGIIPVITELGNWGCFLKHNV